MALERKELAGEPDDFITIGGRRIDKYVESPELPRNARLRAICERHRDEHRFEGLTGDWLMSGGCVYPDEDEPSLIRFQHVCPGPGIIRECRLKIVQYNEQGKKIGNFLDSLLHQKTVFYVPKSEGQT